MWPRWTTLTSPGWGNLGLATVLQRAGPGRKPRVRGAVGEDGPGGLGRDAGSAFRLGIPRV